MFWNEWRTIQTRAALNEGASQVISIQEYDAANEWALVHYISWASADWSLVVDIIWINEEDWLKFQIKSEVFQWRENTETTTKDNLGWSQTQTTEYTYVREWSDSQIDSNKFAWPDGSEYINKYIGIDVLWLKEQQNAQNVKVWNFDLADSLVDLMTQYEDYIIDDNSLALIDDEAYRSLWDDYPFVDRRWAAVYISQFDWVDTIWDMRMTFHIVRDQDVSVIWKQSTKRIEEYRSSNGVEISMLEQGKLSASEMFAKAKKANELWKWIFRISAFLAILGGFNMVFRPLVVVAKVVPIVAWVVWFGTGLISFVLAVTVSVITIAVAWVRFMPIFSIIILAIWAAIVWWIMFWRKKNKKEDVNTNTEQNTVSNKDSSESNEKVNSSK